MIEDGIDSRAQVVQNAADEVEEGDGTPLGHRQLRRIQSTGDQPLDVERSIANDKGDHNGN